MSLQKYGLISLSIISLGMNIVLCAYILRHKKAQDNNDVATFFASYVEDNARICVEDINEFLTSHQISLELLPELCILVPPYPCGACIDNTIDAVLPTIRELALDACIIVPKERARDVRVKFAAAPSVGILEYTISSDETNIVYSIDSGILLCRSVTQGEAFFISSPWNSAACLTFIDKHCEKL